MTKIAALQMVSSAQVVENLHVARDWAARAAAEGVKLLLLPEYFAIMANTDEERLLAAEPFGRGLIQDFLAATAQKHDMWLIAGSVPILSEDPQKIFNASLVFEPSGKCHARYDKIHLFSYKGEATHYAEADHTVAGNKIVSIETPFARIGLSICYDLRFPELFRAHGTVDLLVMPAAFTASTGRDHWEILLRARAIENQCYLLAAAQGGQHENARETWGHSMFIDPWGKILEVRSKGQGLVMGDINPERILEVRQKLPALAHKVL